MNIAEFNPSFNPKTFFLDSSKKKQETMLKPKDIVLSSAIPVMGGYAGYKAAEKNSDKIITKIAELLYKRSEKYYLKIREFVKSPKNNENNVVEGATKQPYYFMNLWLDKIRLLKIKPELHKPNCIMFIGQDEKKDRKSY